MGIKKDPKTNTFTVSHCKRHPLTGKPKTLRRRLVKTKADANRVYQELVIKIEESFKRSTVPTWQELVEESRNQRINEGQTKKTVLNYHGCLRKNTFDVWGDLPICDISTQMIRKVVTSKFEKHSASHQKTLTKFIKATFSLAVENGYLERNPCPLIKFKESEKLMAVLTEVELKKLLDTARDNEADWYYHWAVAAYTGARSSELYALTWDKVNFENRIIQIDRGWNRIDGFKSTKSGNDRMVEIAPNLLLMLKELKLMKIDEEFVLPRMSLWEKGGIAGPLKTFLQVLGLPTIRFHDLRATWATIMLTKGVEPIKVMSMGGWTTFKAFQRYIRKAGVNIKGITDNLNLHDPVAGEAQIFRLSGERR